MLFVGVDLHKQTITLAVVDSSRKLLARKRFSNLHTEAIRSFLKGLGPCRLTVEATASYEWFVALVEPVVEQIILANPGKLRIIAASTRKSDNLDAKVLADMLALDQIPPAYRPTPRQREHRQYVRHRKFLQRRITSLRNKIRRILSDHNFDIPNLFTRAGLAYLEGLTLPPGDRFCVDQLVAMWQAYRLQLRQANKRIVDFAASSSESEQEDRKLLQTVPGIGPITAEATLAELADWRRFSSLKKVSSYVGIVPGQRESAGKRKTLHIEKTGSALLRSVLVQSAWQSVKRSCRWRITYELLRKRIGAKKAIVAISRRLLCVCYSILKSRRPYEEAPAIAREPVPTSSLIQARSMA